MKFWIALAALLISQLAGIADGQVPESQILTWMKQLKPLPKVHYSWPLAIVEKDRAKQTERNKLLYEYVRLTHALSLRGETASPREIDQAVDICNRVNTTNPKQVASLGINFSVWHRRFDKELPPTDFGSSHKSEMDFLRKRMTQIRNSVASANLRNRANVKVTAILFDSERFVTKSNDEVWNAAITRKHNEAYDVVKSIFPDARIEWYARGAIHRAASDSGWARTRYTTLDEKGESFGCSLYYVPENESTRKVFRFTAKNAAKHGCDSVTPWIALASGSRRQTHRFNEWSNNWNYDLIYSWQLGREINNSWYGQEKRTERFAPWNKAKIAVFYPAPFNNNSPHWGQHFVAYVGGANGYQQLPEKIGQDLRTKKLEEKAKKNK